MKIRNLLLFAVIASLSTGAFAQDLKGGEYATKDDGSPAMVGQPTNDHYFVRGSYDDMGPEQMYDNKISFKGGTPQVVEFWLDDDQIYTVEAIQALTPVPWADGGDELYQEVTYNSGEFNLYVPDGFSIIKYKFEGESRKVDYQQGPRMPWDATLQWQKQGTKTIDNFTYNVYKCIISNQKNDACHFSGNEETYEENGGALKKDDGCLFRLAFENANQDVEEGHLADLIIANMEFGIRETVRDKWDANEGRYFFGTGGNNEVQRYMMYHRVGLYGSSAVVENLAKKTVKSVKYYNIAGMESENPFEGVNIMVTTYNDGTTSTCKVMK